jgi:hypothetical protein
MMIHISRISARATVASVLTEMKRRGKLGNKRSRDATVQAWFLLRPDSTGEEVTSMKAAAQWARLWGGFVSMLGPTSKGLAA